MLFGMFIPYQSILIPLVQVLKVMGLYGSIQGLIFVHVVYGIPITTLIFRNYFAEVPTDIDRGVQNRRRGEFWESIAYPPSDFDARLCGGHDLAIPIHLE